MKIHPDNAWIEDLLRDLLLKRCYGCAFANSRCFPHAAQVKSVALIPSQVFASDFCATYPCYGALMRMMGGIQGQKDGPVSKNVVPTAMAHTVQNKRLWPIHA